MTLEVTVLPIALGAPLALGLAPLLRGPAAGRVPARAFIEAMRNTPCLFQISVFYNGLGALGVHLSIFTVTMVAIALNTAGIDLLRSVPLLVLLILASSFTSLVEVLELLRKLRADGTAMLIVTYEMGFARAIGDLVAFFDRGELAEVGPARDVFDNPSDERAARFLGKVSPSGVLSPALPD